MVQASTSQTNLNTFLTTSPDRKSKRSENYGKGVFSSTSLALRSVSVSFLLGCSSHSLWDCVAQVLSGVMGDIHPVLTQAIQDGCDAAEFTIHCGLDTTDSMGRAIGTSIAICHHAWLKLIGFSSDVQASLTDMLFDGTYLVRDKADSALERFKEIRATAHSLVLSALPHQPHQLFLSFQGSGMGTPYIQSLQPQQGPSCFEATMDSSRQST